MKKFLFFVVFIFFVSNKLFAAQGCLFGGQVYTTPPSGWYQWTNPIQDNCPGGSTTSTTYADVSGSPGSSCRIGFLGFAGTGNIVNYDIEFCPIDDYIPLIIVMAGATGAYFLRKNQFAN